MGKIRNGLFFLTAAFLSLAVTAQAEETADYVLEADTVYELDLQGDDTPEQFSFQTYTVDEAIGEAKAILELYLNDTLVNRITEDDWSYYWEVSQCPLADGRTYLLAASLSDNDWSPEVLLLEATENGFETILDLADLTRQDADETNRLLSYWARASVISDTAENTFTVDWLETFRATGMVTVPVTYVMEDGVVSLLNEPCVLDGTKNWTAWQTFDVLSSTEEGAAAAYQVVPGDVVQLTECCKVNENIYFKCINQNGEEGWLPDAESYDSQMTEDGQNILCGYFEEAIYAG